MQLSPLPNRLVRRPCSAEPDDRDQTQLGHGADHCLRVTPPSSRARAVVIDVVVGRATSGGGWGPRVRGQRLPTASTQPAK